MINIEDKNHKPDRMELSEYVKNDLFDEICQYMEQEYKAIQSIEYSGDKVLLGWNLKFKKSGKTLCTIYPREGHFPMLLIVGRKEKDCVEKLLPTFSEEFQNIYNNTKEGMGQRWMLLDFYSHTVTFDNALEVVRIRRTSK